MKITMKDLIIISFAAVIGMLAMFKIVDLLYIKDKSVYSDAFAFIGTIIGGVLSGTITLLGVRYTIIANREADYAKDLANRIEILNDVLNDLFEISKKFQMKLNDPFNNNMQGAINTAYYVMNIIHNKDLLKRTLFSSKILYSKVHHMITILDLAIYYNCKDEEKDIYIRNVNDLYIQSKIKDLVLSAKEELMRLSDEYQKMNKL